MFSCHGATQSCALLDDGSWELIDLGSHNGTYVNGSRIERAMLAERDLVSIGQQTFRAGPEGLMPPEPPTVSFAAIGLQKQAKNGTTLLDDVSFTLNECALLGVVGPSGAGKSTLLGALTGRRPAPIGTVWYGDRDLYREYEDLHRRIGLVPQDDVVHTELTVADALEYSAELRFPPDVTKSERLAQVEIVMSELGLAHRRNVVIARLSGGERKRVSVAIELLTRPALLFLDEPTSGLDPGLERSVMEILRSLADGGRTVVVITHSVRSLGLCDRVLVLAPGGRTAYFGPPQLAPSHFGKDDFEAVFQELSRPDGQDWKARFRDHPDHDTYIASPLAQRVAPTETEHRPEVARLGATRGWLRQVRTLHAPLRGSDARRPTQPRVPDRPSPGRGAADVVRAALRAVAFARQRTAALLVVSDGAVQLRAGRYLVGCHGRHPRDRQGETDLRARQSRWRRPIGLPRVQAVGPRNRRDPPSGRVGGDRDRQTRWSIGHANVLGWGRGELMLAVALTGIAAMTTSLVISAFVRTADVALTVLPLLLILQNMLAVGGVFPQIVDKPVLKQLSYVSSSAWGFSAAASTADLNELQAATNALRGLADADSSDVARIPELILHSDTGERRFDHESGIWFADVAALAGLAIAGAFAAGLLLARREPRT